MPRFHVAVLVVIWLVINACNRSAPGLFESVPAGQTGIGFENTISPTDEFNVLTYNYLYNGAGVGIGDFNRDGLPDLFFAGNQVSSRLYLNRGEFRFEDKTNSAGVATNRWCTGVSVADVNADGWPDIYVSVANHRWSPSRGNLLFINQGLRNGSPIFREMAAEYGLADSLYCSQAAFFDFDRDGDLDCYLLHNFPENSTQNNLRPKRTDGSYPSTDRLLRNDGSDTRLKHPVFHDVSQTAGISIEGYGLGLAISDLDQDGWPDVYCANDFISNDLLWLNQKNNTFRNAIGSLLRHQSYNSMGVDVADYDNDARPDLLVLDMLPEGSPRQKIMLASQNFDKHVLSTSKAYGYQPQFIRNVLQRNNGPDPKGQLSFSEVGQLAGVEKTDWSWSCLFADYDNDGFKDLSITNGYRKDVTDRDFLAFSDQFMLFGSAEAERQKRQELLAKIPEINVEKYAYRNRGDGTFEDVSSRWGLKNTACSSGAVYADLDGDGDLDWVMSNIDEPASVYRNLARQQKGPARFLSVRLQGEGSNRDGFGAKVWLWTAGKVQYQEMYPIRGYLSSVEPTLHFGLGSQVRADSLRVVWPDGRSQTLRNVTANQTLTMQQARARVENADPEPTRNPLFQEISSPLDRPFRHIESPFIDFNEQPLLPHKYSQNGFGLAVGDVNGDGREDVFAGNASGSRAGFFLQQPNGRFRVRSLGADTLHEDMGTMLFDADRDGDLDLYVVSGSAERPAGDAFYTDRLYLNDGKANFKVAPPGTLPTETESGSCVVAADYDHDGDLDLFVGGRTRPGRYPLPGRSLLLRNDTPSSGGKVRFTDVTPASLREVGMVCAALWTDLDNDAWPDLLLAGEWMPLTVFKNEKGRLIPNSKFLIPNSCGWYNALSAGDFDNDGDVDYVAGNLGLNSPYKASPQEPLRLIAKDFDQNGKLDPILVRYYLGKAYPTHPRDALVSQLPVLRKRFNRYADYANATIDELFPAKDLIDARTWSAVEFRSVYLENHQGRLVPHPLPTVAQTAPLYGMLADDFDGDGNLDVLLTGNSAAPETIFGPYDAFNGLLLRGSGSGQFRGVSAQESGFFMPGDAKGLAQVRRSGGRSLLMSAVNNEGVRWFEHRDRGKLVMAGPNEVYALLELPGGRRQKREFYYGQGYLSQSSRSFVLPQNARGRVFSSTGSSRPIL